MPKVKASLTRSRRKARIRRLHEHLGISAEVLIRPSRKTAA